MAPSRSRRPPRAGALQGQAPLRIVKQICLLQIAWYLVAFVLILFTTLVAGKRFNMGLLLNWKSLRGDTTVGWTLGLCWMLDSAIGVIFLLILVNRSKLIPDFALTLHFLHFLAVTFYTRELPSNYLWWGLMVASSALMTFGGIWACQWRELQPMAFGGTGAKSDDSSASAALNGHLEEGASKIDSAVSRILGRGRNADGGGNYEMVRMREDPPP